MAIIKRDQQLLRDGKKNEQQIKKCKLEFLNEFSVYVFFGVF